MPWWQTPIPHGRVQPAHPDLPEFFQFTTTDSSLPNRLNLVEGKIMLIGYVYILASRRNGTLYTGVTNNLYGRVLAHREGKASPFTARYNVKMLVWHEEHELVTSASSAKPTSSAGGGTGSWP
jgi:predicted GIY-YIG superfamily endonuclease